MQSVKILFSTLLRRACNFGILRGGLFKVDSAHTPSAFALSTLDNLQTGDGQTSLNVYGINRG